MSVQWSRIGNVCISGFLAVAVFTLLLMPLRFIGTHDTDANRLVPLSILRDGDINLREFEPFEAYVAVEKGERIVPLQPIFPALLVTPAYFFPEKFGWLNTDNHIKTLSKILASLTVGTSMVFLFLTVQRFLSRGWSFALVFLFAFGTIVWTTAAQDYRDHSVTVLVSSAAMFFMMRDTALQRRDVGFAAFLWSLLITIRLTNIMISIPMLVTLWILARNYRTGMLWSLLPVTALAGYNTYIFGSPLSHGYEVVFSIFRGDEVPWWFPFSNVMTLLVNPSKGLLVYSPFFVFSIWGAVHIWRNRFLSTRITFLLRGAAVASLSSFVFYVFMSKNHGGTGYGVRYLIDIMPLLILLCLPIVKKFQASKLFQRTLLAAGVWALLIQVSGIVSLDGSWNWRYDPALQNPPVASTGATWVWDPRIPPQPLYYFQRSFIGNNE